MKEYVITFIISAGKTCSTYAVANTPGEALAIVKFPKDCILNVKEV